MAMKKMNADEKVKKKQDPSNMIFVGCMFLGIAIGMLLDQIAVGTLAGLGIGFIAKYLISKKS